MPRKNVDAIQIHVPEGTRQVINAHAKRRGFAVVADYIRNLIESDMRTSGIDISLKVKRGGTHEK